MGYISSSADVSELSLISTGVAVWNFSQIRENAVIGENSIIGSYVYIDANVQIGANCKIQNRALIYDSARISNGVFIGPGVIITNDKNPRAVSVVGQIKANTDWEKSGVEILEGASIGAGSICIAPVRIGKWASIGAGSVVTKDVKNYALVVGNPARQIAWVGPSGVRLALLSEGIYQCPRTLTKFEEINEELHEIISE
jgi:acetyltransferase-like isoleucine patch superfamily enzyme